MNDTGDDVDLLIREMRNNSIKPFARECPKASPAKQVCICLIAVRAEDDCVKCVAKCKVTCKKARAV